MPAATPPDSTNYDQLIAGRWEALEPTGRMSYPQLPPPAETARTPPARRTNVDDEADPMLNLDLAFSNPRKKDRRQNLRLRRQT